MVSSIPASAIVSVNPQVLSAGGSGLDLLGLVLSTNSRIPAGFVLDFSSVEDVSDYFGPTAKETQMATVYFAGYANSFIKPASMLFYRWAVDAIPGALFGGSVAALTLPELQALTGTLTITFGGTAQTSTTINLSAATSFANAATIIQAAFTTPAFAVSYDAVLGCFVFTSTATGDAATIIYATGTLAAGLKLTMATGAILSQGSDAEPAVSVMDGVVDLTQNFASFTTAFVPTTQQALGLAQWNNGKNNRYLFALLDTNIAATTVNPASAPGAQIVAAGYSGTAPIYAALDRNQTSFLMGLVASLDFTQPNGDATAAFKRQTGMIADVVNRTIADRLEAAGYNYYGSWATANEEFSFFYPGAVTGDFRWIDAYVNQIWLNNFLQLALMDLLVAAPTVPYNADGRALIEASMMDPVNAALSYGAIRPGVTLSESQRAQINSQAGFNVADTVEERGWYILVGDAAPSVRASRGSPPITLWYTDGGAVQRINVQSVEVQ